MSAKTSRHLNKYSNHLVISPSEAVNEILKSFLTKGKREQKAFLQENNP